MSYIDLVEPLLRMCGAIFVAGICAIPLVHRWLCEAVE